MSRKSVSIRGDHSNPHVTVHGGTLVFSGARERWEALADNAGAHDIVVRVSEPGWESFSDVLPLRVSHLLDLEYEATTKAGVLADADLTICGQVVLARSLHQLEPGLCEVSVPRDMRIGDVAHKLVLLEVNGQAIQPGGRYNFAEDSVVRATYEGVVTVEARATFPDGMSEELLWAEYAPGDVVTVLAEPRYDLWGLVWDRPDRWTGLPSGAIRVDDAASWEVTGDVAVNVEYKRDMTYLIIVGAAALGAPVGFLMRGRILGLLSR